MKKKDADKNEAIEKTEVSTDMGEVIEKTEISTDTDEVVEKIEIPVDKDPKKIEPKKYLYAGLNLVIGLFMLEHNKIYVIDDKRYNLLISQVPKLKDVLLEINNDNSKKIFKDLENKKAYFKKISLDIKNEINKVGE